MSNQRRDVGTDTAAFEYRALLGKIYRAPAVGVDHDRRDSLREDRLRLAERRISQPFSRMRVDVDDESDLRALLP